MRITRHFFDANKPVAVVCHGVEIVAAAGVLKGRTMTTVAKCALDVTQFGGTYVDKPCVIDRNLISARTWHDYHTEFMKQFIERLHAVRASSVV
jgi:protease I